MEQATASFKASARKALEDPMLQRALVGVRTRFVEERRKAVERLPEFEALRDAARDIRDHTLAHLDEYLEGFEAKVKEHGGEVHWCRDAGEARDTVLALCRAAGARVVSKGKTMVGEEIGLNDHLEAHGITPVETDLGEYIIQLAGEPPSHITAPAVHKTREQVADLFLRHHHGGDPSARLEKIRDLVDEARRVLRRRYFEADVGITGANFLVAETGSVVIVTNEGNGDLTQLLPRTHVVLASLEKVVPTLEDASTILRVLARSATGQEFSAYTTFSTGPRRSADPDGPESFHVVLLDNGRSQALGTEFRAILRCIRCGACLNHCPVYGLVGGHAYGWVYQGPMGAVLTPLLLGIEAAGDLPNASTFCGRCEAVCPVRIPLPGLMRRWREREFERRLNPPIHRLALRLWAWFAVRPRLYHMLAGAVIRVLGAAGRRRGRFRRLPLASGWTRGRDMPAPEGRTFHALWAAERRHGGEGR